jgi:hypothetical protein
MCVYDRSQYLTNGYWLLYKSPADVRLRVVHALHGWLALLVPDSYVVDVSSLLDACLRQLWRYYNSSLAVHEYNMPALLPSTL